MYVWLCVTMINSTGDSTTALTAPMQPSSNCIDTPLSLGTYLSTVMFVLYSALQCRVVYVYLSYHPPNQGGVEPVANRGQQRHDIARHRVHAALVALAVLQAHAHGPEEADHHAHYLQRGDILQTVEPREGQGERRRQVAGLGPGPMKLGSTGSLLLLRGCHT